MIAAGEPRILASLRFGHAARRSAQDPRACNCRGLRVNS
jgi:hypothetical protein